MLKDLFILKHCCGRVLCILLDYLLLLYAITINPNSKYFREPRQRVSEIV